MSVYARIMANAEQQVDLARCAEIAETCTNFSLRKVTRMVGAIYDDGLRPSGLKGTQFNQLVALALLRTATVQKLAKILVVDRTSLTRSLVPLERDNLVQSPQCRWPRTETRTDEPWLSAPQGSNSTLGTGATARS